MIKFFRKIRYELMEKNKTGKYLKYAVGEILLVVIGILIALQLNLYKENYEANSIKQNYYHQLLEDLKKDQEYLGVKILEKESYKTNYDKYINSLRELELTSDQFIEIINELDNSTQLIVFNTRTIESLEKSGDIKMLPRSIRNDLIDLKRSQDLLTDRIKENAKIQIEFIKEGIMTGYGLSNRIKTQPKLKDYFHEEFNYKKTLILLDAILSWKHNNEKNYDFNKLLLKINDLADTINNQIEK